MFENKLPEALKNVYAGIDGAYTNTGLKAPYMNSKLEDVRSYGTVGVKVGYTFGKNKHTKQKIPTK